MHTSKAAIKYCTMPSRLWTRKKKAEKKACSAGEEDSSLESGSLFTTNQASNAKEGSGEKRRPPNFVLPVVVGATTVNPNADIVSDGDSVERKVEEDDGIGRATPMKGDTDKMKRKASDVTVVSGLTSDPKRPWCCLDVAGSPNSDTKNRPTNASRDLKYGLLMSLLLVCIAMFSILIYASVNEGKSSGSTISSPSSLTNEDRDEFVSGQGNNNPRNELTP